MLLGALVLTGAGLLAAETYVVADAARPCLNIRDLPEPAAGVLACLDPGERVEMLNWGRDWARIRLEDGTEGWAAGQYLTPASEPPQPAEPSETAEEQAQLLSELTRITFDIPFPEEKGGGSAIGSAETVETAGENVVVASGGVEFRYRDALLQAQRLEVDRSTRDVIAEGEVIFDQGPRRITGTRLEFNLDSRTGRMEDARVFADPDVYFSGTEVSMLGDDVYRVKDGVVTSCIKDNPGWSFRTSNARVKLEGFARMRNTTMRVKKLPVFYLPYMVIPAKSDRAAGFLFPNFGTSQARGSYLGLAWFQPFGPSYDATVYLDLYSESFTGLGTEVRYLPSESTTGRLEAYAIDDPMEGQTRWKVLWDHTSSDLPLGFRGVIRVRDFSDFNFFRDFERDFNNASIRRVESTGFLAGNWGAHSLSILLNENEAFYSGGSNVIGRQLPEVEYRLRSKQLGSLPLYLDLLSSINYISIERVGLLNETYSRADLFPRLTVPLSTLPWLSVSVTGGERITWYGDTLNEDRTAFGGGSRTRTFPTADARIVGPSLSRVFEKGIGKFAKFKHIFEPQWAYIYVGDYEEQSRIPRFDEVDVLRSTNVWGYSMVNRVLAKPKDLEKDGDARDPLAGDQSGLQPGQFPALAEVQGRHSDESGGADQCGAALQPQPHGEPRGAGQLRHAVQQPGLHLPVNYVRRRPPRVRAVLVHPLQRRDRRRDQRPGTSVGQPRDTAPAAHLRRPGELRHLLRLHPVDAPWAAMERPVLGPAARVFGVQPAQPRRRLRHSLRPFTQERGHLPRPHRR